MLRRRVLETLELAREIVAAAEDKKAEDIVLLDLRPDTIIADFFVICTGDNVRQLRAIADSIREKVKTTAQRLPYSVEGEPDSGWLLMDYGDIVVHIMSAENRRYYDLEGLWKTANVLVRVQ
ncbi:MAG: ribosome silencing factor [Candidatus Flexifilum sp.]